jgi:hypothetical protein
MARLMPRSHLLASPRIAVQCGEQILLEEMTMQRHFNWRIVVRLLVVAFAVVALAAGLGKPTLTARADVRATAAPQDSQCISIVPKAWGEFRGGSAQSGLSFEDSSGTLRFVTNLPCGAVPVVALEIRRSADYN